MAFTGTRLPAYFFANQGSSIEILRTQHYMYTTYEDRYGRPSPNMPDLANMRPGDIVIVNVNGLLGVVTVRSSIESPLAADFAAATNRTDRLRGFQDYWRPGMLGLRVDVEYEEFRQPIRYQNYRDEIMAAQAKSSRSRQPFASTGNANQETFYWMDVPLARVLMRIIGRPLPEFSSPPPPEDLSPEPYVAKFAPREIRPEQGLFRERMLTLWKKCPVTGVRTPALLDAAHFEDWRHHNDESAGMLLNPLIHRAVDSKLLEIKLDANGKHWRVSVLQRDEPSLLQYDRLVFDNPLVDVKG